MAFLSPSIQVLKLGHADYYHLLSNSLFTAHPTIQRRTV
jgi:hypothetical protein